jgi:hypothetical protein
MPVVAVAQYSNSCQPTHWACSRSTRNILKPIHQGPGLCSATAVPGTDAFATVDTPMVKAKAGHPQPFVEAVNQSPSNDSLKKLAELVRSRHIPRIRR